MTTLYQALMLILDVIWFIMIAHIILSWLISFQVLNMRQPVVAQIWDGLTRLLELVYAPIRRIMPNTGPLDLAPLVAFIALIILQQALRLLVDLPLERVAHPATLPRMFALRENFSAYDAAYVAAAETLGAALCTADERLARAVGSQTEVEALPA